MNTQALIDTAMAPVADDKGILAMVESNPTCNKRFTRLGIPQTGEDRRAYQGMIVTTPVPGECISGAICSRMRNFYFNPGGKNIMSNITAVPQTPSPGGTPTGMSVVERSRSQSREGWGEGI